MQIIHWVLIIKIKLVVPFISVALQGQEATVCCHLVEHEDAPKSRSQWNTNTAAVFAVFCMQDCLRSKASNMMEPSEALSASEMFKFSGSV